jgi:hypothetical protein
MADTITYFGNASRATYPNGEPIVVNGRPLLIPPNFDLQTQINAARYRSQNRLYDCFLLTFRAEAAVIRNDRLAIQGASIPDIPMPATMDTA